MVFWSSAFTLIRIGLRALGPGELALARYLVASLAFAALALITRMPLPRREDLGRVFFLGLTGIGLYHTALNFGEVSVPAGTASLIIGSAPAFTALLSHRLLGEQLNAWGWAGILISFAGITLISVGAGSGDPGGAGAWGFSPGAAAVLIAAIATSVFFVLQKPLYRRYGSLQLTAYFSWAGTLPMLVFAPGLARQVASLPAEVLLAVIYLGLFPSAVAYVAWAFALSRAPAGLVTNLLYLNPPLALLIAWLALGEVPSGLELAGGMLAIAGVVVVQRLGRPVKEGTPAGARMAPAAPRRAGG
ncbi:MAG TPA: DMT family transporter [Thermaerobacter sp.]